MRPADFRRLVLEIALREGLPEARIIFGGDHLGPNPWQKLHAEEAMALAEAMVAEYAQAGFTKLHLDASMACAGEASPLANEVVAERAARLCAAAEKAAPHGELVYVIGTEVPVPGGATESLQELQVTEVAAAEKTLAVHREVFHAHGLDAVWPRVIAAVVQPGVEFNHDSVVDYVPEKARALSAVLKGKGGLVFEAHSTDYQRPDLYAALVRDGFAILKVGPALTFAMREALFALAAVEGEIVAEGELSRLPEVMDEVMVQEPKYWVGHYHGDAEQQRLLRRYSYSDRIRYYWGADAARDAVDRLLSNLRGVRVPETLLSAHLPEEYRAVRAGEIADEPEAIVLHAIRRAIAPYAGACFPRG